MTPKAYAIKPTQITIQSLLTSQCSPRWQTTLATKEQTSILYRSKNDNNITENGNEFKEQTMP